jgi:hypothetical protein
MTKEQLSEIIAGYISNHNEIDNLGDGESIVLVGNFPVINVLELAETLLIAFKENQHAPNQA